MQELKVGEVIISKQPKASENYQEFLKIVKQNSIKVRMVKQGDVVSIEKNIYFKVLWPNEKPINENPLNNNAIVVKLIYKNFSCLFTGDIENIAERELMKEEKKELKSTVLKVAHHGSKTSTTEEILKEIDPKIALIGVEKNNKFGHPNSDVIKRLKDNGISIYRTDEKGEISLVIDNKGKIKITSNV